MFSTTSRFHIFFHNFSQRSTESLNAMKESAKNVASRIIRSARCLRMWPAECGRRNELGQSWHGDTSQKDGKRWAGSHHFRLRACAHIETLVVSVAS